METSLHRELKSRYAGRGARLEVPVGRYRVDVVTAGRLVEIQHGPLAAIRDKVRKLLEAHRVLVVKPIVVRKLLVKRPAKGAEATARRLSPKRGRLLDLFDDLVHFTGVFPHRRLTLEVPNTSVRAVVSYDPAKLSIGKIEGIALEDPRLASVWGPGITRILLSAKGPALRDAFVVRFQRK